MVIDITNELDKELGSSFTDESLLFSEFDDGTGFSADDIRVTDYDAMLEKDGKASTLEKVLTLPIRQAPWSIQGGKASAEAVKFIDEFFHSTANSGGMTTPINTVIAQALSAIVYKRSYFEKVFTLNDDGKVIYDKLAYRPPGTCRMVRDPKNGNFRGFRQIPVSMEDTETVFFPPHRAWVYIHGVHRNPMLGVSDMAIPYLCFQTKQKIRFLWYAFLEGQSLPKTIVHAPDRTLANSAAKEVVKLRQGGAIGVEDGVRVDAFESSGKGASQFVEALHWLEAEASGSVLAGFTDLGAAANSGTGSFALSKDQTDFFLMSRQAVSKELADSINQYVIPDLVRYNFGPRAISPTFEFGPISQDDMNQAISLLQATAQSPSPNIPREFFEELVERVAGFLELNTNIVRDGLTRARKEAEEKAKSQIGNDPSGLQVAGMAGAVNSATNAIINKVGQENGDQPQPQPSGSPRNRGPANRLRPTDTRLRH